MQISNHYVEFLKQIQYCMSTTIEHCILKTKTEKNPPKSILPLKNASCLNFILVYSLTNCFIDCKR